MPPRNCLDDDLVDIRTLGFRGEALPSIGAVSRLTLASRARPAQEAWRIELWPADARARPARHRGSRHDASRFAISFLRSPARLKFLKSPRAETAEAADAVRRLALAAPQIALQLCLGRAPSLSICPARPKATAAEDIASARMLGA